MDRDPAFLIVRTTTQGEDIMRTSTTASAKWAYLFAASSAMAGFPAPSGLRALFVSRPRRFCAVSPAISSRPDPSLYRRPSDSARISRRSATLPRPTFHPRGRRLFHNGEREPAAKSRRGCIRFPSANQVGRLAPTYQGNSPVRRQASTTTANLMIERSSAHNVFVAGFRGPGREPSREATSRTFVWPSARRKRKIDHVTRRFQSAVEPSQAGARAGSW